MLLLFDGAGGSPQGLSPSLLTNTQTFYSPTVTASYSLAPALFTNAQTFYAPTIGTTLDASLFANSQTFYAPTITQVQSLAPALVTNEQAFYAPTITTGAVALAPPLLTNAQTFYNATVGQPPASQALQAAHLVNVQVFYCPAVKRLMKTRGRRMRDYRRIHRYGR